MDPLKIPIRASTQEHLEIEGIKEDIVILKDGSCCLLLETTAINFGLLSEKEQEATIYAYASLLNSLTFPTQIVIRSKKKDISSYLKLLDEEIGKQKSEPLKQQMEKYRQFIAETVKKNEVLDKQFFLILLFSSLELGAGQVLGGLIRGKQGLPFSREYILERAKMNLYPKKDQIIKQLSRLGLKTRVLAAEELTPLFYEIYNPEAEKIPKLNLGQEYTQPMVKTNEPIPNP